MKQLSRFVGLATTFALAASLLSEPLLAQDTAPPPQTPAAQDTTQPPIELPENPGRSSQNAPSAAPPATSTPQAPQPSGTAAAPAVQVSGSAASKPAGVAIAPPKQRQVRSWLIKFGFIAGAGVAIGTVAALSAGSPGRVPGSH